MAMNWNLEDGLKLVRALSEEVEKFGYQTTLGGSVLRKGESANDLDIYLLPLERGRETQPVELTEWLIKLWGQYDYVNNYPDPAPEPFPPAQPVIPPQPVAPRAAVRGAIDRLVQERDMRVGRLREVADQAPFRVGAVVAQAWGPFEVEAPFIGNENAAPQVKKAKESSYNRKMRFYRPGGDRIDIFVVD